MNDEIYDKAFELMWHGEFQAALDLLWNAIDQGSSAARLALAKLFDAAGLHAFSQDHYLALIDENKDFSNQAEAGVFGTLVWLRNYGAAVALEKKSQYVKNLHGGYATKSDKEYSTINFPPNEFSKLISQLLNDREIFSNIAGSIEALQNLVVIDEHLFNIACDLHFANNSMSAAVSVDVPVGLGQAVQWTALEAIGDPLDRARNFMMSCANLIAELSTYPDIDSDDELLAMACNKGKSAANKLLLLKNDFDLSSEETQFVNNICWGLLRSSDRFQQFAGFVLGGLL